MKMNLEDATLVTGDKLTAADQRYVLLAYTHRYTKEHKPDWANKPNNASCPVQFASDKDWLANTKFAVTKNGRLDSRFNHCHSTATWPDNPELRGKA